MLDKNTILERAYEECMCEMYKKAQPSVDYKQLLEDINSGKIDKNTKVYERYYLSQEEFKYIQNKYLEAYRIKGKWKEYVEIVEDYLKKGGTKDKWIPEQIDDNGFKHPSYRGYEKVPSIDIQIKEFLENTSLCTISKLEDAAKYLAEAITLLVLNNIKDCKEFHIFDTRDEDSFCYSTALGPSPTSNPQTVIDYWKTQGVDIKIEKRNPLLFWEQDYYGDEFEEVMEDEYGPYWKKHFDNEWQEELAKKEANKKKLLESLQNNID